jgi:hypothetical protein
MCSHYYNSCLPSPLGLFLPGIGLLDCAEVLWEGWATQHFDRVENFRSILLLGPYFMSSNAKHHVEGGSFLSVVVMVRSETFNLDLNFATKRGGKISY